MSEQDQAAWAIQALAALKTADNQVVVESIIKVIDVNKNFMTMINKQLVNRI